MNLYWNLRTVLVFLATSLLLAFPATGQLMGGNMPGGMQSPDSTHAASIMGKQMGQAGRQRMMSEPDTALTMNSAAVIDNVLQHVSKMSEQYSDLENHFQSMMAIDNLQALKAEMHKHYAMMHTLDDHMSSDMAMWRQMKAIMQSQGMPDDDQAAMRAKHVAGDGGSH